MGSSMKSSSNNNNNRKPYALMLLLAFGAAILGVMVLHKLREKRIFTLLVKEKDHELLTLHLLFQREKEFNQEARKKIEDMKNKVYSMRTQKLELDRRLSEMESTVSALKDERKVIELTLEEKKNEIQMLTSGTNTSTGVSPQVTALKNMIKTRDEEIGSLKFQLKKQADLQSERTKLVTTSSSFGTRQGSENDKELHMSTDSFHEPTKGGVRVQNDGSVETMNPEKFNSGSTDNGGRNGVNSHDNQDDKVVEESAKETSFSHDEERYRLRFRRKHSKGRRRETVRNRKPGDEEQQKLETRQDEKADSEIEKEEKEAEKRNEEKLTEIKSNGTETEHGISSVHLETKLVSDGKAAKVDENSDEINNELKEQEAKRKLEKMQSIEAQKQENSNDNGQGSEEGEAEDSDDGEPEIDRDDIRRFSESDPEDEGEETEF